MAPHSLFPNTFSWTVLTSTLAYNVLRITFLPGNNSILASCFKLRKAWVESVGGNDGMVVYYISLEADSVLYDQLIVLGSSICSVRFLDCSPCRMFSLPFDPNHIIISINESVVIIQICIYRVGSLFLRLYFRLV